MLQCDNLIFKQTAGQIGETLELAIKNLSQQDNEQVNSHFGTQIPIHLLLLTKERAINTVIQVVKKYWGNIDLFLFEKLQDTSIDFDHANERLNEFLNSPNGKKSLFQYLNIHHKLRFDHLIGLVLGKEIEITNHVGGLNCIYFYKVNNKYFVHIVYNQKEQFWKMLFVKKVYSVFLQTSILSITNSVDLMRQLKLNIEQLFTLNKTVSMLNHLIENIEYNNPPCFQLKELHIFSVITHYNGGRRHQKKLNRIIDDVYSTWGNGRWALTEKEHTILTYMLAIDSYKKGNYERTINYVEYLIHKERLNNHAIELILEYSDVLPNIKPEPTALIKLYNKNYIEKIFFILIDAYIYNQHYNEVIRLLKEYEIASCTAIYDYFNQEDHEETSLHRIEATVQRDIIFIVDHTPQHILHSLEIWHNNYQNKESEYYDIAMMSSKHITNILMALFATEHYELFDKLMEVYTKYIKINEHFNLLRDFVADYVKL